MAARRRPSSTTPLFGCSPPPPRPTGCCSSRTPPYPTMSPRTPTTPYSSTSALDHESNYPAPWMHPRLTTTGRRGAVPRPPRATPARPRLSTSPTSPKLTNSDTRDAQHHQPRNNHKDDDPAERDIAALASPGGSTTENIPEPGLRDPH